MKSRDTQIKHFKQLGLWQCAFTCFFSSMMSLHMIWTWFHTSLCRLIYPGFEITQFFVHLILRIIENPLTRAFTDEADNRRWKLLWVDFLLSWVLGVQRTVLLWFHTFSQKQFLNHFLYSPLDYMNVDCLYIHFAHTCISYMYMKVHPHVPCSSLSSFGCSFAAALTGVRNDDGGCL